MPKKDLLILGAGGFGLAVAEAAELTGQWDEIVFADDRWPEIQQVGAYKIVSNIANLQHLASSNLRAIVAVGNNSLRQTWQSLLRELGIITVSIIHPRAVVSPTAQIGQGVSIMAGCVIGTNNIIKEGVILNIGTLLDHNVIIEAFSHLSVGVKVAGGKRIVQNSFLEVGTCIPH
ncbi:acetyltransferase [Acinetobacter terrae]|uniref:Acetyltransferase n=1 Tax=Acinetobacter terrae TaxID=2731247 RepID=A0A4R0EN83_9GAMM|nr:acetyltransferase [Acinetobacter terrae]TCB59678.1 acetyltransferase [Acinetobacter terrae]